MKTANEVCSGLDIPVSKITYLLHKSGEVLASTSENLERGLCSFTNWVVFKIAYDYESHELTLTVFPF